MNGIDIKCREILPISPIADFSRRNHLLSNNKFDNVASSASLTRTRSAKSPDTKFFKFHFKHPFQIVTDSDFLPTKLMHFVFIGSTSCSHR